MYQHLKNWHMKYMPMSWFTVFCISSIIPQIYGLNISRLMSLYIDACGEKHMCYDWPDLTYYTPHPVLSRCPPCFCDDSCFRNLNCCPDKFFERPLAVLASPSINLADNRVDLYFPHISVKSEKYSLLKYEIIETCPEFSKIEDKKRCENSTIDLMYDAPVTSLATNFSYRNIFCAVCHGEKETGLITWNLAMKGTFIRFINFIETVEQLHLCAKRFKTTVIYSPPPSLNDIVIQYDTRKYYDLNDPCEDDKDLRLACLSSYLLRFGLYQNIFCYMCMMKNTEKHGSLIESCSRSVNNTKQKCSQHSESSITYPYKNFYCYQCNVPTHINQSFEGNEPKSYHRCYFTEISSLIKEELFVSINSPEFRIKFVNLSINTEYLVQFVKETRAVGKRLKGIKQNDFKDVLKSFATIAPTRICRADLLPGGVAPNRQCDCSYSCLFIGKCTCCVDTAIMHPIECISDTKFGQPQSQDLPTFAVVSSCYYNEHLQEISDKTEFETVKHLCETNPSDFDILIWSKKVTYKNIFCFLCNTNYSMENNTLKHEQFEALEFTVMCPNQLNFIYAVNFTQLMNLVKTQGCHVKHATDKCIICETEDREVESRCPDFQSEHPVKWLCENTSVNSFVYVDKYKNEFCLLCNSNRAYKQTNGTNSCLTPNEMPNICPESNNTSGDIPLSDEDEKTTLLKKWTIDDCKPTSGYRVVTKSLIRDLFSPARIIQDTVPAKRNNKNIGDLCYPGKILRGGSCVSVIEYPQYIKYELFIFSHLSVISNINDTDTMLAVVKESLHQTLKEMLAIPMSKELTSFFFLPKRVYQTAVKNGLFHKFLYVHIYFDLMYFIQFHRDDTERFLLKLPNNLSIKNVIERRNYTKFDLKGIRFTSLRQPLISNDSTEMASFLLYKKRDFPMPPSTAVHVSPLMFCRQKILRSGAKVDLNNFRIIDNNNNKTFYLGEFVSDFDGLFRVCVEEKQFVSAILDYGYILEMFATILNVISIVSMITLLILYMIVPGLRTLPGLNTMSTSFSLLSMQLTYTVANAVEKSTLFCTVMGILLHYFWLSLCCCLFTCSLHMCWSFSDRRGNSHMHTNIRSIFGRYVIYCYITPIFIITTNIILTYYIQNKIGYGTTLCFVEDFVQNIATFIAPLLITCVVNIVMFTITATNINSVKHIEKSKKDKSELVIFLKLFSLTGIVWIFQIVDGVLNISAFSFVATLLTSSQGTIIFLSFASSSRILNYFRSKRESKGKEEITDSRQTTRKSTSPLDLTKSTQAQGSSITI